MKKRNPFAVFIFGFITFGVYSLYWTVVTKGEMNERGANIPTAFLLIVPFVNIWWLWKWSEGVELVTNKKMSNVIAFLVEILLGPIGDAVVQDSFNSTVATSSVGSPAPMAPTQPADSYSTSSVNPPSATTPPTNPQPPTATVG